MNSLWGFNFKPINIMLLLANFEVAIIQLQLKYKMNSFKTAIAHNKKSSNVDPHIHCCYFYHCHHYCCHWHCHCWCYFNHHCGRYSIIIAFIIAIILAIMIVVIIAALIVVINAFVAVAILVIVKEKKNQRCKGSQERMKERERDK